MLTSTVYICMYIGHLSESYDELGNRYVIPQYCLNKPTNMQDSATDDEHSNTQSSTTHSPLLLRQKRAASALQEGGVAEAKAVGTSFTVKVRLTTLRKDIRVSILTTDRVIDLKRKLHELHGVDPRRLTMLYSGRVLRNSTVLKQLNVPKRYVIQAIVS